MHPDAPLRERPDRGNATPAFVYETNPICACGVALDPTPAVRIDHPWGVVAFSRCAHCGSYIQNPQIAPHSLAEWYRSSLYSVAGTHGPGPYTDYFAGEAARQREAAYRYRRVLARRLPSGSRVLEVGCATGSFLQALRNAGHHATGIDLSEPFVRFAREQAGLDVVLGDYLSQPQRDASYDAIVMLGTVSNLYPLAACLRRAAAELKPGGFLYLNFPAADSLIARLYGSRYWMFAASVASFLSRRGCRAALQKAGFNRIQMAADWQQPTIEKLVRLGGIKPLLPLIETLGIANANMPIGLPIPGICSVLAFADGDRAAP